jgi:type III secretion system chaperone SycN
MAGLARLTRIGKITMPHRKIVQEFSQRLGISQLRQDTSGPLTFALQGMGSLTLEPSGDNNELLLTLAIPLPAHDVDSKLIAALALCYPDRIRPFPLACGLHHDTLALISRRQIEGSTAADLENQAIFLLDCAKTLGLSAS